MSAVVITFNEERNIRRCIEGLLGIVDEIIVLDSFSTDETKTICSEYDVSFHQRKWDGYAASKNYANSLASNDYIFSVDADEVPDEELRSQLADIVLNESQVYSVNRLTNYCGKWIRHSGWYPDVKIRIFNRKVAIWSGEYVHEALDFNQKVNETILEGHLLHYSYYSFKEQRARADRYSLLTAIKMHQKGKKASVLKPYLSAVGRFLGMYLLKLGFLDGRMGFKIAQISAASNVVKYKELRRLNREERN